jgi:hypothetical protein
LLYVGYKNIELLNDADSPESILKRFNDPCLNSLADEKVEHIIKAINMPYDIV